MARRGKIVKVAPQPASEAFESAKGEIETLHDEMEEWREKMEGTNFESSDKYDRVQEAEEYLQEGIEGLDDVDTKHFPDIQVEYSYFKPYGRHISRGTRLGETLAMLNEVHDQLKEELPDGIMEGEADDVATQNDEDLNEAVDAIRTSIDSLEQVEFPGMYG